jgi:hypothetical protein
MLGDETSNDRSALWTELAGKMTESSQNLGEFRAPGGGNARLAHWEPRESTLRWFKSFLQVVAEVTPPSQRVIYRSLKNTGLGNPVTVVPSWSTEIGEFEDIWRDQEDLQNSETGVNLDYLLAAEEVDFLLNALAKTSDSFPRYIVELGAGFGRTAHTLLHTFPNIEHYEILDLPETLALSSKYLSAVLSEELFQKIAFVESSSLDYSRWSGASDRTPELVIQIDGLQEMEKPQINAYFRDLFDKSNFVYLSNPLGKYLPAVAGMDFVEPEMVSYVHSLGRCLNLLDPWNFEELTSAIQPYIAAYRPERHQRVAGVQSRIRPLYYHILYSKI